MTAATSRLRRRGIGAGVAALVGLGTVGGFAGAAQATADFSITPVSAASRFGTAAAIAGQTFPTGVDTAVLVNAYSPADALAASYVAGDKDAAVLVTDQASLNTETATALKSLGVKNVIIVGGAAAVSAEQETTLKASYTVTRYSGSDRTATALDAVTKTAAASSTKPTEAFIARSFGNPADALAAGPIAYKNGIPILLVPGAVTPEWTAAVKAAGIKTITPLGGTAAIADSVVTALGSDFTVNTRIAGASGQDTAVSIANAAVSKYGFVNTGVGIARGDTAANAGNAADALTSSQWLGTKGFPLVLTDSPSSLGTAASGYLTANAATLTTGAAFGGNAAINTTVIDAAEDAGQDVTSNQKYSVTPAGNTTRTVSIANASDATASQGSIQYTATGLGTDKVDIALVSPDAVKADANGQVSFLSSGTVGAADLTAGGGYIDVVNGVSTGSATSTSYGITPVNGSVSFTVNSLTPGKAIPVIYSQADSNNVLELSSTSVSSTTWGAPTGDFAIGGQATWTAAAAATADYTGSPAANNALSQLTVTSVDTTASTFQATYGGTNGTDTAGTFSYAAAGSTYAAANNTQLSPAQFAAAIGEDDIVTANYNAAGPSQFKFVKDIPAAPTGVKGTYNASTKAVDLSWTASPNLSVTGYVVNRYTVTNGVVGTTPTSVGTATGTTISDSAATSGTYVYTVTATDGTNTSPASDQSANVAVPASADTTAPTASVAAITNGTVASGNVQDTIDAGDQIAINFSEKVTLATGSSFTLRDSDGSVGVITAGGNATITLNSAGTTAFVTLTGAVVPESVGTTAGLSATVANEQVVNSSGVADVSGNQLAEINPVPTTGFTASATNHNVTITFNAPIDPATLTAADFAVTGGKAVGTPTTSDDITFVVPITTLAANDVVTLKANSVTGANGGNGPAAAATATA